MRVTSVASTQLCRAPSREQPGTPVDVWRAPGSSVTGLDPGVVGDRPVPHLLAALLTPACAPHARLPKHWEGRIVSLLALVRHLLLARFSSLLLVLFSLPGFVSPRFLSPRFFLSRFSPLSLFSSQNVPPVRFISLGRLRGVPSVPSSPRPTGPCGYHDDPCALKKMWASELAKDRC